MAYIQHELEVSMIGDEHGLCVKGGFTTPPGRSCVKVTKPACMAQYIAEVMLVGQ